jgi:hypothetical protein
MELALAFAPQVLWVGLAALAGATGYAAFGPTPTEDANPASAAEDIDPLLSQTPRKVKRKTSRKTGSVEVAIERV